MRATVFANELSYLSILLVSFAGCQREADSHNAVRQQGRLEDGGMRGGQEVCQHRRGREDGERPQRHLHRDEREGRQERLRRTRAFGEVSDPHGATAPPQMLFVCLRLNEFITCFCVVLLPSPFRAAWAEVE